MTDGHKHRLVRVRSWDNAVARVLRKPLVVLSDKHGDYVDRSRLVFGVRASQKRRDHDEFTLSLLGALHPVCGLTLFVGTREQLRVARLREQGRRLASAREDLIASGVDPALLDIPLYVED